MHCLKNTKHMEQKRQKMKMPRNGSFHNWLMSNNDSLPVAGNYATIMHYTDRSVDFIQEVSPDGNRVIMEICQTQADRSQLKPGQNFSAGHQCWAHIRTGHTYTIVWYRGKWRKLHKTIVFHDKFLKTVPDGELAGHWLKKTDEKLFRKIYDDNMMPSKIIPNITREKISYEPIRILFNVADYYYDWTF